MCLEYMFVGQHATIQNSLTQLIFDPIECIFVWISRIERIGYLEITDITYCIVRYTQCFRQTNLETIRIARIGMS